MGKLLWGTWGDGLWTASLWEVACFAKLLPSGSANASPGKIIYVYGHGYWEWGIGSGRSLKYPGYIDGEVSLWS